MLFDIPRFYISACPNSVQYVRLHLILMSILLYNYKQLTECTSEVERIEAKVNSKKRKLTIEEEGENKKNNTCRCNDSQSYQNSKVLVEALYSKFI